MAMASAARALNFEANTIATLTMAKSSSKFPNGPTDDNVLLINVTPLRVGIWDGEQEDQLALRDATDVAS